MKSFDKCNGTVVHFDAKQLVVNRKKREMLAVVVTGSNKTEQIIDCRPLRNGTGLAIAERVFDSLETWGVSDFVKGKSYDTTNSNSGEKNGAGVLLEGMLERKLLDLLCRHHIYELVLMTGYKTIFNPKTTSPDDTLFKTFRDEWNRLDHEQFNGLDIAALDFGERQALIDFCEKMNEKLYVREDYEEFIQLALMCLSPQKRFKFKLPGAVHHARWMARAIYGLKMYLFRDQFSSEDGHGVKLERFVLFVLRVYLKGWFQAPLAIEAPRHDMEFLYALSNYDDSEIAAQTSIKFKKHLWYLSELNVCLAFFDSGVEDKVKRLMVKRLSAKSIGKNLIRAKQPKPSLPKYVTQKSLDFFKIMNINTDFLFNEDPSTWRSNEYFLHAKACCQNLSVINDCAERAVALCGEYNGNGPKDENEKNQLLITVAKNRKHQKNSLKTSVTKYLSGKP